jgi:hypothetical protein
MTVQPESIHISMDQSRNIFDVNTRPHSLMLPKTAVPIEVKALLRLLEVLSWSRPLILAGRRQISLQVSDTIVRLDYLSTSVLCNTVPLPIYHSTLLRDSNLGPLPAYQSTWLPGSSLVLLPVYQPICLPVSDPTRLPDSLRGRTSSINILQLNLSVNKSLVNHILNLNMLYPSSSRTIHRDMSIFILIIWTGSYPEKNGFRHRP